MKKSRQIYLDYAAATPMDEAVFAAMKPYFSDQFYNPSATYLAAKKVKADLHLARGKAAAVLGARPDGIIFTAGGTEANNLAIHGVMEQFPGSNMVTSAVEHESVRVPARKYEYYEAPVTPEGEVDVPKLVRLITDTTVLVSVMHANNEVGTIQPLARIASELKKLRHERMLRGNTLPLYFHTDACQSANYLPLFVHTLGVDMMTLNGGKIYGPKQTGVLYVASHTQLAPQILGGGQEQNKRSGTENIAGIVGFSEALRLAKDMRDNESRRLQGLQELFVNMLAEKIPGATVNGSLHRLANNVHVTFPGSDNETLLMQLDEHGIQAASGSACSASKDEPSHVLTAMGIEEPSIYSSLRFTMGRGTTENDIRRVVEVLATLVRR